MKQIIIWVLALGICSINVSAQTKKRTPVKRSTTTKIAVTTVSKERQVESDGYIWYKLKKGNLYGAQDVEGNIIVPVNFSDVFYGSDNLDYSLQRAIDALCFPIDKKHYFSVFKDDFIGIYSTEGKCIIPTERHYIAAALFCFDEGQTTYCYFRVAKNGGKIGICDLQGREVIPPIYDGGDCDYIPFIGIGFSYEYKDKNPLKFNVIYGGDPFIRARKGGVLYLFDLDGNEMWAEKGYSVSVSTDNIKAALTDKGLLGRVREYPPISFNKNTKYDYTNYELLGTNGTAKYSSSSSSSSSSGSSSSSSSSSNNNSGNNTTTIVVEPQHTPQPMQEWQQCTNCWGEGKVMCLGACGGTGTYYVGDRLHICNSCGGKGKKICPNCSGQGGKYITVYK